MGILREVERNADNRVNGLAIRIGVVFPNTNQTGTRLVVNSLSVKQILRRRERFRGLPRGLLIDSLVREIGEIENSICNEIRRSPVFMDS